jgi:hypothetical protein
MKKKSNSASALSASFLLYNLSIKLFSPSPGNGSEKFIEY